MDDFAQWFDGFKTQSETLDTMENQIKEQLQEYDKRLDSLKRQMDELKHFRMELKKDAPFVKKMLDLFERMGIDRSTFFGHCRKRGRPFFARCVFSARLRKYGYTFEEIAGILQRNHATVVYYVKSYNKAINEPRFEREFIRLINEFNELLNNESDETGNQIQG